MILKLLHICLALLSFCSFAGRIALSQFRPEMRCDKWLKISPPIIDTALLISGTALAVQGSWLIPVAPWLAAKLTALAAYIGFGAAAMRLRGSRRWMAFAAAICCYGYVLAVAVSKNTLLYF